MRVLYLVETLGVGGTERSLLQLLPRMTPDIEPIMCHLYEGEALRPEYEAAGVPVVSLDIPPKYRFAEAARRVAALVERTRPDLIHTALFRSEVVGRIVGRWREVPVVCSFVSECYADLRWQRLSRVGRLKLAGVQALDRLTASLAAHFVANSAVVKHTETASLGVEPSRVTVIHRGRVPADYGAPLTDAERRGYLRDLNLPDTVDVVLCVGRLVPEKGHAELVDAFVRVLERRLDARLLLAGEGPEREAIRDRAAALGVLDRIRLLGRRDDVPQLLALADVFVSASHYEGHPGAVVEAMLAATPVVLSDTPVHRETVGDGEGGLLATVQDSDALARGLSALLDERPRALALGCAAQAIARRRYDVQVAAERHTALYRYVTKAYAGGARHIRSPFPDA